MSITHSVILNLEFLECKLFVACRMEELIILHYGNFTILGKRVKEYTQQMGCSNWVADQALCYKLFLDEM